MSHDRTPKGCQTSGQRQKIFTAKDLAPLQGATQLISHSGGLRGLRPPATFFATLRVAEV